MKSICIKTNNQKELDYLVKKYSQNYIDNTKIKVKKFKIYYNFIIHYLGDDEKNFEYRMSIILSEFIIENYEERLLKRCINKNYFYYEDYEKEIILKIALKILEIQEIEFDYKEDILADIILEYIIENSKIYLEGMINFRLKEYIDVLDYLIELSVMNYLKYV